MKPRVHGWPLGEQTAPLGPDPLADGELHVAHDETHIGRRSGRFRDGPESVDELRERFDQRLRHAVDDGPFTDQIDFGRSHDGR